MLTPFPHFIIIDDSQLDCFIGEKIIQNTGTFSSVKSYIQATEAYEAIKNSDPNTTEPITIIVLDIQMPVMNGFQFVEAFEQLPESIRSHYAIFMFSSSINENDKNRLENHPCIRKFYSKPISKDIVASIVDSL
ncbi:response regulator [Daejeonella lutea]|uniref:Response regulator receiver domain-containing protein n=1 Tax=Daejeonella lutea TaxID=572036 RepID=A0A1T5DIC8_9SPHI|nr:response regulator [Daejeonella lutea]SKB71472.1 Response regulator receiver domain-containing protein [Daejeonella lutea]